MESAVGVDGWCVRDSYHGTSAMRVFLASEELVETSWDLRSYAELHCLNGG